MNPETPTLTPEQINQNLTPPEAKKDSHGIMIASMAAFVLMALAAVAFLYYQNQQLKIMLASYQATPVPTTIPAATPSASSSATVNPVITSPKSGAKVVSPLTITGTVPTGWMFEGVFPIKLVDANQKLIVQGQAKEKVAGSWQSGNPVDFTATLTFTATGSGTLVLQNDNPSGDPTKSQTFQIPVSF